jgi:two-component system NtrC family sensor kinase
VRSIGVCGGRIAHVVRGLRSYARLDEQTVSLVDIREGLEETLTLFGHELRNGIELVRDLAEVPLISGNPAALNQVWSNLIDNAMHAMHGRGRLTVSTAERRSGVAVRIADTGAGISAEHLPKIFDLRFTTKHGKADFGLGLGLAIVQSIVRQHGGEILVDSQPGATTFEVWFPKAGV